MERPPGPTSEQHWTSHGVAEQSLSALHKVQSLNYRRKGKSYLIPNLVQIENHLVVARSLKNTYNQVAKNPRERYFWGYSITVCVSVSCLL